MIYYPLLLERTYNLLKETDSIIIPDDIPKMVETVYQKEDYTEDEMEKFFEQMFSEDLKSGSAKGMELHSPQKSSFSLGFQENELLNDEDDGWVSAKTRLAEESVRMAFLPHDLYESMQNLLSEERKIIPSELAKEVVQYSFSVSKRHLFKWTTAADREQFVVGSGKIKSVYFTKAREEEVKPTDDISYETSQGCICINKELGLVFDVY